LLPLDIAKNVYNHAVAMGYKVSKPLVTVVDFDLPSTAKRLFIINVKTDKVVAQVRVAHGKNSGGLYATQFSNVRRTYESSLGVYLTGKAYEGKHGYSVRLQGISPGYNTNALQRGIVFHPAYYMKTSYIKRRGEAGRSWGCFAVNPQYSRFVMQQIEDGTLVVAYRSNSRWLSHSKFI
jgi:hypothetical protein